MHFNVYYKQVNANAAVLLFLPFIIRTMRACVLCVQCWCWLLVGSTIKYNTKSNRIDTMQTIRKLYGVYGANNIPAPMNCAQDHRRICVKCDTKQQYTISDSFIPSHGGVFWNVIRTEILNWMMVAIVLWETYRID